MADQYLSPTPYANQFTGYSNDLIQGLLGYMKDKQRTQQMQGLAGLLESTGIPQSVERSAYAQSPKALLDALTNVNRANVPLLKAETADALMTLAPMVGPAARAAERGAMAAGRAGERVAERVVPQVMERGGLPAQLLGDLSQGTMSPLDVYHGTPYKFDRFDSSKIGTGEGAQVYGHGLYVAENPMVAKQYADNVKDISSIKAMNEELSRLVKVMDADSTGGYRKFKSNVGEEAAQQYDDLINRRNSVSTAEGNLYKADLPDEKIAKMLDWDKPLSQQHPDVQAGLKGIAAKFPEIPDFNLQKWMDTDPLASTFHNVLNRDLGVDPALIANTFKDRGITGIKYLDQSSRQPGTASMTQAQLDTRIDILKKDIASGLGNQDRMKQILSSMEAERDLHTNLTRNFVVFPGEEQNMTILERNNKPMRSLLD